MKLNTFYVDIKLKTKGAICMLKLLCLAIKIFAFFHRLKSKLFRQKPISIVCDLKTEVR